jgi:uncharacterized membrane protein (DUF373 family)
MKLQTWQRFRQDWAVLGAYQRFESLVGVVLTLLVALIIVVALYRLTLTVAGELLLGVDPLDQDVFQVIFGEILTLLIALEFNHTLQYTVTRQQSIIQTKVVLLIALLALARKFIVLDLSEISPAHLFGLAVTALALGVVYWLMRERDDRLSPAEKRREDR